MLHKVRFCRHFLHSCDIFFSPLANLHIFLYFFLIWEHLSQDQLYRLLPFLLQNDRYLHACEQSGPLFFNSARDVAMATDFMANFGYMRSLGSAAFENGLQYRHSNSKIFSGSILVTFCANKMKISLVTPEIMRVTNWPFGWDGKNRPISPNISPTTGPIFTNVWALGSICMGITKLTWVCSSPRDIAMVTINFGGFLQKSKLTVFTLCSRVPKRNALSPYRSCINSYSNCTTSYKKMMKIGPVVFELKRDKMWKLCWNLTIVAHWARWHFKMDLTSQFWF